MGARERLPVGRQTCAFAAKYGQLEVLKWARENGCPWDEHTRSRGVEGIRRNLSRRREDGERTSNERAITPDERGVTRRDERCDEHASDARAVSVVLTAVRATAGVK